MPRKFSYLLVLCALLLAMLGCGQPGRVTEPITKPIDLLPSATPLPPQPTPTLPPPPTATSAPTEAPLPAYAARPADQLQLLYPAEPLMLTTIHMLDAASGWAVGSGQTNLHDHVFFTQDGGAAWSDRTPPEFTPPARTERKVAYAAFRGQRAWVIYQYMGYPPDVEPVVWSTGDAGLTWTASAPLNLEGIAEVFAPDAPFFVDDQHGWLMTHVGGGMNHDYIMLFATSDGGLTWQRIADPFMDNFPQSCSKNALVFTSPDRGILTGDCNGVMSGVFFHTTSDGGLTWTEISLPAPTSVPDLMTSFDTYCGSFFPSFASAQDGALLVNCNPNDPELGKSILYVTADGGGSWSPRLLPLVNPTLQMLDARTGWIIKDKVFRTDDGGQTWMELGAVSWQGQPDFVDAQNGWAAAKAGVSFSLQRTSDGGATWTELQPVSAP